MTGATRQNIFRLKRSNVSGKLPIISQLLVGEMAVNTQDGFLYTSISNSGGTATIGVRQIGWDRLSTISGGTVNGSISATTYYGDGSNLTGIPDNYVTGGTYFNGTLTLNRQNGSVTIDGLLTGLTNTLSTGVYLFTGITSASSSTFTVSPVSALIVDGTSNPLTPIVLPVYYSGGTHTVTNLFLATETYVLLSSGATIFQQTTFPTDIQRRQNIFLGKIGHANKTSIINVFNQPDYIQSPLAQLRDMFEPIGFINGGVYPSPNGTNLSFNTSAGELHGLGVNYINNTLKPNSLTVPGQSPVTFQYRTQTGGTSINTTLIDPTVYDLNGVVTPVNGTKATNQRIYLVQNGIFRVQYGQTEYSNLAAAVASISTESFTTFSNFTDNALLIGVLSVDSNATDLSDPNRARFFFASKFGETIGSAGGFSTTTLQQAYNNSTNPEIVTNSTLDGVQFRGGTGNNGDANIIIENNSGIVTGRWNADGSLSATTFYGNGSNLIGIPDNYVTGGTYSSGTLTLNRQNGSVIVTGFTNNLQSPYKTSILTNGTSYTFTDFNIVNTLSINKTTGSTTTVILNQTPQFNDFYVVKDRKGDSFTNQIVITGGTYTIDGNASVIMKSKNNPSLTFLFDGSEYIII
jgi:hypothetical protein